MNRRNKSEKMKAEDKEYDHGTRYYLERPLTIPSRPLWIYDISKRF
ncbi:MAG: hypothetical protein P1U90_16880 [Akkermansiaceae bacterium]|nr:hypothetical protein [Akkermansiaceae bacterium]